MRAAELFDRCFELDPGHRISASQLCTILQLAGCTEKQKNVCVWLNERFESHAFVRRVRPQNVRTWIGIKPADVALGALNRVVTHTNTQSRTMRLPRGYPEATENPARDQSISSTSTRWSTQSAWPERQVVSRAGWAASTGTRLQAGCRAERVAQV